MQPARFVHTGWQFGLSAESEKRKEKENNPANRKKEGFIMAHGITATDGMAYVGRVPWHGLGVQIDSKAMTAAEAIEAAGLDWLVSTTPIYTKSSTFQSGTAPWQDQIDSYNRITGKMAVVREDTGDILGMVSEKYKCVQNTECFKFFDSIVGAGEAVYQTVGSLFEGRKVWILAHMGNGEYKLDNGDLIESYVLLDTSHDGSSALRMRHTPVRVVCANTLGAALTNEAQFYARHTAGIAGRVSEARDVLGLNKVYMERFMAECNQIADKAFSSQQMERFTYKMLKLDPDKDINLQHGISAVAGEKMIELFHTGLGNKGETRWDAFNAVTEFADFYKGSRAIDSIGSTDDDVVAKRLQSSWFGEGQGMRGKAWNILRLEGEPLEKALEPDKTPIATY